MTAMFERETRREKILEARNKELRLKEKTKGILGLGGGPMSGKKNTGEYSIFNFIHLIPDNKTSGLMGAFDMIKNKNKDDEEAKEDPIQKAEREFFEIIKKVSCCVLQSLITMEYPFLHRSPKLYFSTLYPPIIVKFFFLF